MTGAVVRLGNALLHLGGQLADIGAAPQPVPLTAAVQGPVPCDPGQELVKVAFWLMGRDGAPLEIPAQLL